ncbi:unnamed protein product [Sphenostylis stenocarpa]|uniref:Uncharacterized protein n=1 Tax=Sphenostylis stenocarpa TaxID=92480 RepID=A0AA86ST76_9FABA|nr:unnamed protein product [Sphenostylis stenocarpa]
MKAHITQLKDKLSQIIETLKNLKIIKEALVTENKEGTSSYLSYFYFGLLRSQKGYTPPTEEYLSGDQALSTTNRTNTSLPQVNVSGVVRSDYFSIPPKWLNETTYKGKGRDEELMTEVAKKFLKRKTVQIDEALKKEVESTRKEISDGEAYDETPNNGSSLNVMPKSTLEKLSCDGTYMRPSSTVVRSMLDPFGCGDTFHFASKNEICNGG